MAQHTPGPVHVQTYAHDSHTVNTDRSAWEVAHCTKKENAEFIARAFNSYDDLLAACKAMYAYSFDGAENLNVNERIREIEAMARAAIAKAEPPTPSAG